MVHGGYFMVDENDKPKLPNKEKLQERRRKFEEEKAAALAKQAPINTVTIEYLKSKIKEEENAAKWSQDEAARTGDPDAWDYARFCRGKAAAYHDLIVYIKGLTWREECYQIQENKL